MKIKFSAILTLAIIMASCAPNQIKYPDTPREDVVDEYFGVKVEDPYRWLENDTSEATAKWVEQQNEITQKYLSQIPFRESLKKHLTKAADYPKMGTPFKENGKYYSYRNTGLQNQSVLYVQDSLNGEARVVLDPNNLSTDGTVALQNINFSKDGRYLAYVISRSGSDWNEIYVLDLETGELLPDHIEWAKFTDAQWLGDGFFYSAYDAPADGNPYSAKNEYQKVYYHKLGTPQSEDRLEYQNLNFPLRFYHVLVAKDESYMVLTESEGHGNNLYIKDLKRGDKDYTLIHDKIKDEFTPFGNVGDLIYFITNTGAPMHKVVAATAADAKRGKFKTIIGESDIVLNDAMLAGDKIIAEYEKNASSHPVIYSRDGKRIAEMNLPGIGSVGISADRDDNEAFFKFNSYTTPGTVYSFDINNNSYELFYQPELSFNPEDYQTEQVTFKSKDGTPIKMFLTYKKGMKRDGNNPVFLYGYGGFNISLNPAFSAYRFAFVEAGGIWAVVNLRGGGEYGEKWHQAGTKLNKQNVFDDFISAAEWLVAENYTQPKLIAANGGSNGGLLIGAVVNQRPDLFGVAVPQVGVMDMLRYHKFTIGWNWAGDYGTSEDSKEMFDYLYAYSPLHNIAKNGIVDYPPIMVTTADHDDRVVPAHSFKYAATLQAAETGMAPKLIRIDSKAGHGGGKPTAKVIDEYTDVLSFIMYNLGMNPKFDDK